MSLLRKFGNHILHYILHTFGSNLFKNYRSFWESEILVWDKDIKEKDLVKGYKLPFSVCRKRDFKTLFIDFKAFYVDSFLFQGYVKTSCFDLLE